MTPRSSIVDFIVDQLAEVGPIAAQRLFGGYGLSSHGRTFALICSERLFYKTTSAQPAHFPEATFVPPFPGAKLWVEVPADRWDDTEWLVPFTRATLAALPLEAPKRRAARSGGQCRTTSQGATPPSTTRKRG